MSNIIQRMKLFVEQTWASGQEIAEIRISSLQLAEFFAASTTPIGPGPYTFWGIPLVVDDEGFGHGTTSQHTH